MTAPASRNEALGICFGNLKGQKSKDLLQTARALRFLRELPEFNSNRRLGEAVGVSGEIVRQFVSLLALPDSVQSQLKRGELGLEQGRRLWQLSRARPEIVEEVAQTIRSRTAMESRDLIEYLIRTQTASVQEGLSALDAAKPAITHEYHIDAILDEQAFRELTAQARKRRVKESELVSLIVSRWLEEKVDK